MKDSRSFLLFWLINSAFFYFAPFIFTGFIVSGNVRLTAFLASIISGFLLTIADAGVQPLSEALKMKLKEDWQWTLSFLLVNVLGIWLIARYADLTGIGISNAWMAVLMGAILTLFQWLIEKFLIKN